MLIDTHCHLNYSPLEEQIDSVVERAKSEGIEKIICVGTSIKTSETAISIAEKHDCIFATAGIHPHDATEAKKGWQKELEILLEHEKVVAMGEIGIDYFRDYAPQNLQLAFFNEQMEIAKSTQMPMIIHNRKADNDVKQILLDTDYFKAVLHCFSSNLEYAEEMINLGLLISFTGNATYGSKKTEKVIKATELSKIMLETDAPFLPPAGKRGTTNEPANIPIIAKKIAELKNSNIEEVANITTQNALTFFRLPK